MLSWVICIQYETCAITNYATEAECEHFVYLAIYSIKIRKLINVSIFSPCLPCDIECVRISTCARKSQYILQLR